MKIKKIAKIIIFCVIFLFLLNRIYYIFSWKDTAGDYRSSMNSFYALEEDVVDVLFLGSSHCYCSVNPSQLWEEYGMGSFNMAISGQNLASTYFSMKEALKTQDLQVICVDLYGCTFDIDVIDGNVYRNTLSRKFTPSYIQAVYGIVDSKNKNDYIFKWPIIHTRYRELQKEDFTTEVPVYLGYSCGFKASALEKVEYYNAEPQPFGEKGQKYILKMIELAQESDTELVFFVAPYYASEEAQGYIAYAKEMAKEHNVPVIDMIELCDEVGIDWTQDLEDGGHTNYYGATKVTAYLGEYLKANYELADHRGDERYALWDVDLQVRKHEVQNYQLRQISHVENYFDALRALEDYTVVVSTAGEYVSGEKSLDEYLQMIGIYGEFYENTGIWVFDNNEQIFWSGEADMLETIELSFQNELVVGSFEGVKSIVMNQDVYRKVEDGINILVYDNLSGQIVDNVGFDAMYAYGMVR